MLDEACTDEPHLRVNPGDPILSVNGNQGSDTKLVAKVKQDPMTSVAFKRAKSSQGKILMHEWQT